MIISYPFKQSLSMLVLNQTKTCLVKQKPLCVYMSYYEKMADNIKPLQSKATKYKLIIVSIRKHVYSVAAKYQTL